MRVEQIGNCTLYHGRALDVLPTLEGVEATVIDPPYNIDFGNFNRTNKLRNGQRVKADKYENSDWDNDFSLAEHLPELQRISEHMIVWGGNYFPELWAQSCKGFIFWHKHQPVKNFSDGELAWSSIDMPAQCIDFAYYGNIEGKTTASKKQHPTQKPVHVMQECIGFFKHNPQTILDCFMGSGTTLVACAKLGLKGIGVEENEKYFEIACERVQKQYDSPDLFVAQPQNPIQEKMEI